MITILIVLLLAPLSVLPLVYDLKTRPTREVRFFVPRGEQFNY